MNGDINIICTHFPPPKAVLRIFEYWLSGYWTTANAISKGLHFLPERVFHFSYRRITESHIFGIQRQLNQFILNSGFKWKAILYYFPLCSYLSEPPLLHQSDARQRHLSGERRWHWRKHRSSSGLSQRIQGHRPLTRQARAGRSQYKKRWQNTSGRKRKQEIKIRFIFQLEAKHRYILPLREGSVIL